MSRNRNRAPIVVTPLSTLCVRVIAQNFQQLPVAHRISDKSRHQLLKILPLDIDIETAGQHIHDEGYWEKRCRANEDWQYFELDKHCFTWKQMYYERYLQDRLQGFAKGDDQAGELLWIYFLCESMILMRCSACVAFVSFPSSTDQRSPVVVRLRPQFEH